MMIILSHMLHLESDSGEVPVEIRVFKPFLKEGIWYCRYEIDWPEGQRAMDIGGIDALQSLMGALQIVGVEIHRTSYHEEGQLRAPTRESGYGFPIVSNCRDMLVGNDAKYL
jgi:hypothetical protein